MSESVPSQGPLVSPKGLPSTLIEIAHVRPGLVLNELVQQKLRLFDALLLAVASLAALALGAGATDRVHRLALR